MVISGALPTWRPWRRPRRPVQRLLVRHLLRGFALERAPLLLHGRSQPSVLRLENLDAVLEGACDLGVGLLERCVECPRSVPLVFELSDLAALPGEVPLGLVQLGLEALQLLRRRAMLLRLVAEPLLEVIRLDACLLELLLESGLFLLKLHDALVLLLPLLEADRLHCVFDLVPLGLYHPLLHVFERRLELPQQRSLLAQLPAQLVDLLPAVLQVCVCALELVELRRELLDGLVLLLNLLAVVPVCKFILPLELLALIADLLELAVALVQKALQLVVRHRAVGLVVDRIDRPSALDIVPDSLDLALIVLKQCLVEALNLLPVTLVLLQVLLPQPVGSFLGCLELGRALLEPLLELGDALLSRRSHLAHDLVRVRVLAAFER
mmetsp:Transcript_16060/g.38079  ORF Transcript_16060/g.38079 Transcript_16060/m.38079 type:complete len:381 (-) Transcript_16060:109-1251(-)